MDAKIVGGRIANLRKSHNMTQKQLADELSVTDKAVSKWETGAGLPDIAILPALATALNVSVDEIVSGSSNDDSISVNPDNQSKTVRRYIRKPLAIIISSLAIALVTLAIILSNLPKDDIGTQLLQHNLIDKEDLPFYEGIIVQLETASGFGITADQAKELYNMQLAEDIRTQLLQHYLIDDAAVLIDTAEASPFRMQENEVEAKVSVILTIADTYTLSDIDMQTIEELIKGSVPGIKDENIRIT